MDLNWITGFLFDIIHNVGYSSFCHLKKVFQQMLNFETTALIPGSFDPPHKGHIALIERAVRSGIAEKFVVAAIKNPTKKRLLDPQNSVDLLEAMLPDHLRRFVVIEDGSDSTLATAKRHQADVVMRGRIESTKDALHETALKYFFGIYALCKRHSPMNIMRELNADDPEAVTASSTKIRHLLQNDRHNKYFELAGMMGPDVAGILVEACDATPYPLSWPQGRVTFNTHVARLISQRK
jgi:cytidyltransferase-like protein